MERKDAQQSLADAAANLTEVLADSIRYSSLEFPDPHDLGKLETAKAKIAKVIEDAKENPRN